MKCDPLEPRVFLSAVKVMPLGDSITEGWPGPERVTYRFWLWKRLELAGYDVDFVGSRTGVSSGQPLYTDWDQNHQGLSGWTADEVAAQATSWANAAQPDIVLLHIGTNDLLQSQSVSGTINEVKQIIDNLRVARPNVDIFLCKIIPSTINASAFVNFNNQIPGVVAEKDTQQSRVIMVDQFTGFSTTSDEFDGIHPNARGERKMSTKFYAGLTSSGLLPAPTPPPPPAVTYLSDLNWTSMTNGFGPAERDQSVGPDGADDGGAIWLSGVTYAKGLGTHAHSEIVYNLAGNYAQFRADVGIDDEAGAQGSAVFQVWVDGVKLFDSGVRTGNSATLPVTVDVAGKNTLRLVVTNGGNGEDWDHGDWANARLTTQPTVASSSFAFATAPHRLSFTFRGNVSGSLDTEDLLLENLTTSQTVPSGSISVTYNGPTNTATFTFPGFTGGILPDGRYRATVRATGITDAAGNPMPADHVFNFVFVVGDANNDGDVNLDDFNLLAANFGQSNRDFTQGDFNYDDTVNLADFNILAARFGAALAPASSRASSLTTGGAWKRVSDMIDAVA